MKDIKVYNITKRFGNFTALNNVTVSILPEKITAFIGPNGAGKTTLFHIITGELKPNTGKVYLGEENITGLPAWRVATKGIGRLFQDVRFFGSLTVLENVIIAIQNRKVESPIWSLSHPLSVKEVKKRYENEAMSWIEFVGLEKEKERLASELSFGQQKLLSFARLMAGGFDILLLDEPTAGIHPKMIKKIENLLEKIVSEHKKTVAIIEHNMSVILNIADWVYFMNEGQIAFFGRADHVLGAKEVREAYLGL